LTNKKQRSLSDYLNWFVTPSYRVKDIDVTSPWQSRNLPAMHYRGVTIRCRAKQNNTISSVYNSSLLPFLYEWRHKF